MIMIMGCDDFLHTAHSIINYIYFHSANKKKGGGNMVIGYVLISTAPTKEHDVYDALLDVNEIVELHPLFGEYDLIAKIEVKDYDSLGTIVIDRIRSIPGIVDSKTLTGIKFT